MLAIVSARLFWAAAVEDASRAASKPTNFQSLLFDDVLLIKRLEPLTGTKFSWAAAGCNTLGIT
jgi:hypothetical protein